MTLGRQDRFHQLPGVQSGLLRFFDEPGGCSAYILLVRLGHVLGYSRRSRRLLRADMRGHAQPAVEDLHTVRRQADLVNQRVRHTVEVPLDFDVIVDVDAGPLPLAELVARGRQWLQRRPIQLRE